MNKDASLTSSLAVLVNISRNCLPVQMQLRCMDKSASLRRALSRLIGSDDNEVVITTLAAMTSTGMSEDLNKMVSIEN